MDQVARALDSTVRVRMIGSFEELEQARAQWQARMDSGTATHEDLIEWILTIDNDAGSETIPTSMGMEWIAENPQAFQSLVGDVDVFVLELGERYEEAVESGDPHNDLRELGHWFFRRFLCVRELAELLSAQMREAWVARIYPRLGAINDRWVDHVRNAGVPRDIVSAAILQRLEYVQTTAFDELSVESLERHLSLPERVVLARQLATLNCHEPLKTTAQFLYRIVCALPKEQRETFWVEVVTPLLRPANSARLYAAWRQLKLTEPDLEDSLRDWLSKDGYRIGTIVQGPRPKGGTQLEVRVNGRTFIQSSKQPRYFPETGDLVVFAPKVGRILTPTVRAVNFIPVMEDARD